MYKRLLSRACGVAVLGSLSASSWCLALWNTAYNLPQDVANGIVKIKSAGGSGTGTILDVHLDDPSDFDAGAAVCVLTADHVLLDANNVGLVNSYQIGLKDGGAYEYATGLAVRGPTNGDGTRVDLGMLGFHVDSYTGFLAQMRNPSAGIHLPGVSSMFAGTTMELGGYGNTNVTPVTSQQYTIKNEFGTLRVATDQADEVGTAYTINGGGTANYSYSSLRGKLHFGLNADGVTVDNGSAYVLSGDSGGPTYFSNGGQYSLVGVHSASTTRANGTVQPGDQWKDVYLNGYTDWINQSCAAVPEPTTIAAVGLGLAALVRRRRK